MRQEHIDLWREAIDDDAERVWNGIGEDVAPPLRRSFTVSDRPRPQRWLLAAAIVLAVVTGMWNFLLTRQLAEARADYLVATLAAGLPANRLTTLHRLSGESLSADAEEALRNLVRFSEDPNVQLAALDLLLDGRALSGDREIEALIEQVRHNSHFVEAAVRARSIRI